MKPQPSLVRALGPIVATAITVGTVIGSGVFKKPGIIADEIPYFGLVALAWILGGTLTLLGSLAYAECAVLFPRAGGNYVFLREGYGRLFGFLWGWVEFWIIRSASIAALATIFTSSMSEIVREAQGQALGFWPQRLVTVAVIVLLALVNVRGIRWGGGLQLAITLVKIGSLLFIIVLPFLFTGADGTTADTKRLEPVWSGQQAVTLSNFVSALLAILWAYHGWMNIAWVAEEVREPQRNLPIALLGGVGIVIVLYLGANFAYSLVLTQEQMKAVKADSGIVSVEFARRLLGPIGVTLISGAIMMSTFGALNGNLMVGPRMLYAMSNDGLAPTRLGAVHPTYHTPALATLVMASWSCLLVLGAGVATSGGMISEKKDPFDMLTDFAMFGAVIFETMAVVAIFVFRRRLPDAPRPYRCLGYPITPALYVILPGLILGNFFIKQQVEAAVGTGFILLGCLVYAIWLRGREAGAKQ